MRLPRLSGLPIFASFRRNLTAHRGKLISRASGRGTEVYAVSFIRQRRVVFDASLLNDPPQLRFFAVHEIFHFVWARLGNAKRAEFGRLLKREFARRAQGALGESSAISKARLRPGRPCSAREQWRDYVCESFCDTAAWLYAGGRMRVSLAERWRNRRRRWFAATFSAPRPC